MSALEHKFSIFGNRKVSILDPVIPFSKYTRIDLSITNTQLTDLDLSNPDICQGYISMKLAENSATVAFGGYLERRNLYRS